MVDYELAVSQREFSLCLKDFSRFALPGRSVACCRCMHLPLDGSNTADSISTKAALDPCVQREVIEIFANLYLGNRDRRTPLASPLHADLRGLPPLLIQVGTAETLLDDSTRLADRARAQGVEVTLDVWDDMIARPEKYGQTCGNPPAPGKHKAFLYDILYGSNTRNSKDSPLVLARPGLKRLSMAPRVWLGK